MSLSPVIPEERFATVVEELLDYPGVTPPADGTQSKKDFGSNALKIHQKIFAMLVRGKLVVKLPKTRVNSLISAGKGENFDPRHDGRLMKEWLVLATDSEEDWLNLAKEAMQFVGSKQHNS